jgi:hypothetical protein
MSAQALPGRPTNASTDLPAYAGPPADAPLSAGPLTRLRAAVDLTPATPGVFARAVAAVAAPDGGAYVVLTPADRGLPSRWSRWRVTSRAPDRCPSPALTTSRASALPDGAVAVTGRLAEEYGVVVADPVTGAVRTTVLTPAGRRIDPESGRSALSPGSPTLYRVLTVESGDGNQERLFALDTATGHVLADRDLADDVAAAWQYPVGRQPAGLVARPGGGATLVFDTSPTDVAEDRIPTLLTYDAQLESVGGPVRATGLAAAAETQSVSGAANGTVFLLVAVEEGARILGVPDGGGAGPLLAQPKDRIYSYALVVEPTQLWAVLPTPAEPSRSTSPPGSCADP